VKVLVVILIISGVLYASSQQLGTEKSLQRFSDYTNKAVSFVQADLSNKNEITDKLCKFAAKEGLHLTPANVIISLEEPPYGGSNQICSITADVTVTVLGMSRAETVYAERTVHLPHGVSTRSSTASRRSDAWSSKLSGSNARGIRDEKKSNRKVRELGAGKIDSKFN
jgi:hypothetical protein